MLILVEEGKDQVKIKALDETDIQLLKSYGQGNTNDNNNYNDNNYYYQ